MGETFAQGSDPVVWKSGWIITPGFYICALLHKGRSERSKRSKTRASTHRVSLTIQCAWLLLGIFNFSVKNFTMGVIHHVQTINFFHHSRIFSNTIALFIKTLKNSILVQKVIQCLSTVEYVSDSLTVCSACQWFICEIPREQRQAV